MKAYYAYHSLVTSHPNTADETPIFSAKVLAQVFLSRV